MSGLHNSYERFVEKLAAIAGTRHAFIAVRDGEVFQLRAATDASLPRELALPDARNELEDGASSFFSRISAKLHLPGYADEALYLFQERCLLLGFLHTQPIKFDPSQQKMLALCVEMWLQFEEADRKSQQNVRKLIHDLRNPLTVVTLHAELLAMEDDLSEDAGDACRKIRESGRKMMEILETASRSDQ